MRRHDRSPRLCGRTCADGSRSVANVGQLVGRRGRTGGRGRTERREGSVRAQPIPPFQPLPPICPPGTATNGMSRSPTARCIGSSGIATPTGGSSMRSLTEHDTGHKELCPACVCLGVLSVLCVETCLSYIELHTASAFSFLQGASLPEALVDRAAELGYPALALLDRDGVYGAPRFHKAAPPPGCAPIIGAELTITAEGAGRAGQAGTPRRRIGPACPAHPAFPPLALPVLCESQEGYRNLCRLITRMKLRAPKGEGALTLDELDGSTRGLVALAGRRRSGAQRAGASMMSGAMGRRSARSPRRPVRPRRRVRRAAAALPPRRGSRQPGARRVWRRRSACRSSRPTACGSRRRPSGRCSTCSPAFTTTPTLAQAGRRLAPNAERYLQVARGDGGALRRSAGRGRPHARARRSAAVHDGRSRLPVSRLSGAARRDAGVVPAADRPRSARAIATGRITTGRARRSRASSISSRSSISPATS